MRKLSLTLIAGPLRIHKIALLVSLPVVLGVMLTLLLAGVPPQPVWLIGFAYLLGLVALIPIMQTRISAKLNDVRSELSLRANLAASGWSIRDFYLDCDAANPSLMFLLFKCLQAGHPRTVLELGSGQTTKLLARYASEAPDARIVTLEEDAVWAERIRPDTLIAGSRLDYRVRPVTPTVLTFPALELRVPTKWFSGVDDLAAKRFELILVDGPNVVDPYSRVGLLHYIPGILADDFVVVFDDAERDGEIRTLRLMRTLLERHQVDFRTFEVNGIKRQYVFCSPSRIYLESI